MQKKYSPFDLSFVSHISQPFSRFPRVVAALLKTKEWANASERCVWANSHLVRQDGTSPSAPTGMPSESWTACLTTSMAMRRLRKWKNVPLTAKSLDVDRWSPNPTRLPRRFSSLSSEPPIWHYLSPKNRTYRFEVVEPGSTTRMRRLASAWFKLQVQHPGRASGFCTATVPIG